jgi:hypothetical protein
MQDIYMVVMGLNPSAGANASVTVSGSTTIPMPKELQGWFYIQISPFLEMRRDHKFTFPGGFPLYYADPGDLASIYFAVVRSRDKTRTQAAIVSGIGNALSKVVGSIGTIASLTNPAAAGVTAVATLIPIIANIVQTEMINCKDNLRYTNVLTFRKSEKYLVGKHTDWGTQRADMTLDVCFE